MVSEVDMQCPESKLWARGCLLEKLAEGMQLIATEETALR